MKSTPSFDYDTHPSNSLLISYFSNCPLLQGKPKFFIVQACRGDDTDVSFPENVEMFSDLEPRRAMKRTRGDYDTVPIPSYGELNTARPTWEDMIIAYSTIPGKEAKFLE